MGVRNPFSARKTREATSKLIDHANAQRLVMAQMAGAINEHSAIFRRGFFGRLRWVLFGLPKPPKRPVD